jgi:hypothetical protein
VHPELDAMILRKRHWRRVYFNRRCGHLAGAYDYFLAVSSSSLVVSSSSLLLVLYSGKIFLPQLVVGVAE